MLPRAQQEGQAARGDQAVLKIRIRNGEFRFASSTGLAKLSDCALEGVRHSAIPRAVVAAYRKNLASPITFRVERVQDVQVCPVGLDNRRGYQRAERNDEGRARATQEVGKGLDSLTSPTSHSDKVNEGRSIVPPPLAMKFRRFAVSLWDD